MQSLTLALAIAALLLALLALGAAGASLVLQLSRPRVTPVQPGETTVEIDVPQTVLDQMPQPKQVPQTVEEYTRMIRESRPEFLFDSED